MAVTLRTSARIRWDVQQPASAVLLVRPAETAGTRILDEDVTVEGATLEEHTAPGGARPLRIHAEADAVTLRCTATVEVDPPPPLDPGAPLPDLASLDLGLLAWTLPSRYCPADLLAPTAADLFGDLPRDAALPGAVRDWVHAHVAYTPGASDAHTAADETLLRRAGVCRDLAHLTATLLRGLGVPARLVAAYALDLEPPDFHAVVEAHDGVAWRLLDATGLAPTDTLVRIATGRDAAEIAWATDTGGLVLADLDVTVARA